jgi:hypothetical protein
MLSKRQNLLPPSRNCALHHSALSVVTILSTIPQLSDLTVLSSQYLSTQSLPQLRYILYHRISSSIPCSQNSVSCVNSHPPTTVPFSQVCGCQDGASVLETVDTHSAMNSSDVITIFLGCMVTELYAL